MRTICPKTFAKLGFFFSIMSQLGVAYFAFAIKIFWAFLKFYQHCLALVLKILENCKNKHISLRMKDNLAVLPEGLKFLAIID